MIIKVIPKIKLPLGANAVFDYETDLDNVSPGQIVLVEFRRRVVEALVLETRNNPPTSEAGKLETRRFKLKPILRVLDEKPMVGVREIEIMKWMSEYYFIPLANVVKMFVPEVPDKLKVKSQKLKVELKIKSETDDMNKLTVMKSRLGEIKRVIDEILGIDGNVLFIWNDLREKILVYIKLVERCLREEQPVLILLPQVADLEFLAMFLEPRFGTKLAIFHAGMGKVARSITWRRIQENKAKIILGTRSAILAPMKESGLIVIDEEESSDHKQYDMNPRYDGRRVAEKFGKKVVFASSCPRVETYEKLRNKEIKKLRDGLFLVKLLRPGVDVELVDMGQELGRGEYVAVSLRLEEEMRRVLEQGKKVILFLNRKGLATMVLCRDCQFLFKCSKCDLPLVLHEQAKQLVCHHCGKRADTPLFCPRCSGENIKFVGTGTERVEREVRKLFPDKKVIRIDKDTIYYKLDIGKYDIIVGTQLLLKDFKSIDKVGLFGIISLDIMLARPDFRASEKLYQLVSKVLVWARYNKVSRVLWQSALWRPTDEAGHYFFRNKLIDLVARQDYEAFLKQELVMRKKLYYPPFCKLVKFIYKDKEQKKARDEAQRLARNLWELRMTGVVVIGPVEPLVREVRGNFIENVVLKVADLSILKRIPWEMLRGWLVDVEPEEL